MMEINQQQQQILRAIEAAGESMIDISHRIHANPELGYQERFASSLLCEALEHNGFVVERGYAGIPTAFCARNGEGRGGRVAFLAEYDALPEIGHACGHNIIATSALSAGIGLGSVVGEVGGEVLVIGTRPKRRWAKGGDG
jgi:metal-dependent amidase/aminoacylase/carboxypeptidase family protein